MPLFPAVYSDEDGICIDLDQIGDLNIFFDLILRYIYHSFRLEYVMNSNKKIFPRPNSWFGPPKKIAKKYHLKECKETYDPCGWYENATNPTGPVEFHYKIDTDLNVVEVELEDKWEDKSEDESKNPSDKNEFKQLFEFIDANINAYGIDHLFFISKKDVFILNNRGYNHDHRGSDHTAILLEFKSEVNLKSFFSMHQLIDASYLIKSHKFEHWYELFCGVEVEQKKDRIECQTDFDHGS